MEMASDEGWKTADLNAANAALVEKSDAHKASISIAN
jgi:hypothetical protein